MKEYKDVAFDVKAEDIDTQGFFKGYASTFGGPPDAYGDIIEEGAFAQSLTKGGRNGTGVRMLWQHDPKQPIGVWRELAENKKGLKVTGQLAIETQLGHDAYVLMKMGALDGLSIGYDVVEYEIDGKREQRLLKKVNLWEISPVTFPANTRSTITNVKGMIEEADNERDLERALREAGLSINAAKYVVKLARPSLREAKAERSPLVQLEKQLEFMTTDIGWGSVVKTLENMADDL